MGNSTAQEEPLVVYCLWKCLMPDGRGYLASVPVNEEMLSDKQSMDFAMSGARYEFERAGCTIKAIDDSLAQEPRLYIKTDDEPPLEIAYDIYKQSQVA